MSTEEVPLPQLTRSAAFRRGAATLGEELGRSPGEVLEEATAGVAEMAARHKAVPMWIWRRLGRRLLHAFDLEVDEAALRRLRAMDADHTLVWLPSHRSYLDTWALPLALDRCGFPPYYVMGGINLDFWPFGDVARRTGLVFIRRSNKQDPAYRFALRQYLAHLVRAQSDFGWSIEGGRTRTGKLRPPRYGLLRYLTDAVREQDAGDVLLVPVSIVYDELQEVPSMAAESRGATKPAENIGWLLEFARRQRDAGGRIYIDFADPIPLAARLAELEQEGRDAGEEGGHEVERVALEVCHRINSVTPITPAAAMTIALLAADRALTLNEVVERVTPMAEYFARRGYPVACAARLQDADLIATTLDQLVHAHAALRYDDGLETVWTIGPEQHLVAAFYRNSALHFLVGRAIAELVLELLDEEQPEDPEEAGGQEALRLRELLKFEFFFPRKREFLEDIRKELEILFEPLASRDRPVMAHLVLRPFLEAYLVVAEQLVAVPPDAKLDEAGLVKQCLATGQRWSLQRRLGSAESVSSELFATALKLIRHRELIGPGGPELTDRREAFAQELRETVQRVAAVSRRARVEAEAVA